MTPFCLTERLYMLCVLPLLTQMYLVPVNVAGE